MSEVIYGKGLKSLHDPRMDEYPRIMFSKDLQHHLPPIVSYKYIYPDIDDQGPFGTCTAFGSKKVFEFFYRKRTGKPILISADAIYSTAKHSFYPDDLTDDGLQVSDVLKVLEQFYVLDQDMPYDPTNFQSCLRPVPPTAKKTDFLIKGFASVNPTVEDMKLALYHHGVLVIGIMFQNEWMKPLNGGILQPSGTTNDGGHCMSIVGYEDNLAIPDGTHGAFLIANNWGINWGDRGYCWLPYSSQTLPSDIFTVQA